MAASLWEQFWERVGYGLGAVIYGPGAAVERRANRAMRSAFRDFCRRTQGTKLLGVRHVLRATVTLDAGGHPLAAEVTVKLRSRSAELVLPLERLPAFVAASIDKHADVLHGIRQRRTPPRALAGSFRVDSETLDDDAAKALVEAVATGPLDTLWAVAIELRSDLLEVEVIAPTVLDEWLALEKGIADLVAVLLARWPPSYR
jgi:hypothetical protein